MASEGIESAAGTASESASQLLAKILNQLSLSAWLPSAALVLLIGAVMEIGHALDAGGSVNQVMAVAFASVGGIGIGTLLLLGLVVVVATMLTQAFAFGAIRILEGYWGTVPIVERIATWSADRCRRRRARLRSRYRQVRLDAVQAVLGLVEQEQRGLVARGERETFTAAMRDLVVARVTARKLPARDGFTDDEWRAAQAFDWRERANPNLRRREISLRQRIEDYPDDDDHVLPTRLGNVLRVREDATGRDEVENFVEAVFHQLPFSLQVSHDEQRTRLDLYCSMVFVFATAGIVAVVRFGVDHWTYQLGAILLAIAGCWTVYRAAIASARYYGTVLVAIAEHVRTAEDAEAAARSDAVPASLTERVKARLRIKC